jgi:DNA-binding transcriptional MerR regulator/methylmalonyl-CoA mutase cobalamin-binding subunit
MSEVLHAIKAVSKRTGLSAHVIRVWEKRYGAVKPARTGTNRRLYSEHEVERLELLHHATRAGHNISQAAKLTNEKLRELARPTAVVAGAAHAARDEDADEPLVADCLAQVRELDEPSLNRILERAMVRLGHMGFLNRVAGPLCQRVGELWRTGALTAAHEHFLSAALRTFLGNASRQYPLAESAPGLIVATPTGQLHELGAVMVTAAAANLGWRVIYLGASLPAAEIAGAAIQNKARAVALSLVYPEDDATLADELANLRRYLPAEIKILAGGRAAEAYREALNRIGALHMPGLNSLMDSLDELRKGRGNR